MALRRLAPARIASSRLSRQRRRPTAKTAKSTASPMARLAIMGGSGVRGRGSVKRFARNRSPRLYLFLPRRPPAPDPRFLQIGEAQLRRADEARHVARRVAVLVHHLVHGADVLELVGLREAGIDL